MHSMKGTNLVTVLPKTIFMTIVNDWIGDCDLARFDSAYCSRSLRNTFLHFLIGCKVQGQSELNYTEFLDWVVLREMTCKQLRLKSGFDSLSSVVSLLKSTSHLECLETLCCSNLIGLLNGCNSVDSLKLVGNQSTTVEILNAVLQSMPNLNELNLVEFNAVTLVEPICVPSLKSVVCDSSNLAVAFTKSIHCESYMGPIEQVRSWLSTLSKLKTIVIADDSSICDNDVILIADNCPLLTCFDVSFGNVTDKAACHLVKRCPSLRTLSLASTKIGDTSATCIGQYCHQLTNLNASSTLISDQGVKSIVKDCHRLSCLRLVDCKLSRETVDNLTLHCRDLEILDLAGIEFGDNFSLLPLVTNNQKIHSVNFSNLEGHMIQFVVNEFMQDCTAFHSFSDEEQYTLRKCDALGGSQVCYHGCDLSEEFFLSIQCPRLTSLHIQGNQNINDECIEHLVLTCPLLTDIEIVYCSWVSSKIFYILASACLQLVKLNVNGLETVSNESIYRLVMVHSKLEKLWLTDSLGYSDLSLKCMATNCHNMKSVDFTNNNLITTRGVVHLLQACSRIIVIIVEGCVLIDSELLEYLVLNKRKLRLLNVVDCPRITSKDCRHFLDYLGRGSEHILKFT